MMNTERWQLTRGMMKEGGYIVIDIEAIKFKSGKIDLYKIWSTNGEPNTVVIEDHEWAWKLKHPMKYSNVRKVHARIRAFMADYWYELE